MPHGKGKCNSDPATLAIGIGGPVLPDSHQGTESAQREKEMSDLCCFSSHAGSTAVPTLSSSTEPSACEMGVFLCLHYTLEDILLF